ncbi:hypothetical protein F750_0305 [Streptomyces sp. PAMC 26508]|nr:hypothetical protein F750_0305 [Streptomyces sp. PAMC 26508]
MSSTAARREGVLRRAGLRFRLVGRRRARMRCPRRAGCVQSTEQPASGQVSGLPITSRKFGDGDDAANTHLRTPAETVWSTTTKQPAPCPPHSSTIGRRADAWLPVSIRRPCPPRASVDQGVAARSEQRLVKRVPGTPPPPRPHLRRRGWRATVSHCPSGTVTAAPDARPTQGP